jgi:hypothetical protein
MMAVKPPLLNPRGLIGGAIQLLPSIIIILGDCLSLGYELLAFTWFWNYSLC